MFGNLYSNYRNITWNVDKVRYFDGATFVINSESKKQDGVSLGSYININIRENYSTQKYEPNGKFTVINDPLFMHEYGHYLQSQKYGPGYLVSVGIPSILSVSKSEFVEGKWVDGEYLSRHTHDLFWTETNANRRAANYFGTHYGINWEDDKYYDYPLKK